MKIYPWRKKVDWNELPKKVFMNVINQETGSPATGAPQSEPQQPQAPQAPMPEPQAPSAPQEGQPPQAPQGN